MTYHIVPRSDPKNLLFSEPDGFASVADALLEIETVSRATPNTEWIIVDEDDLRQVKAAGVWIAGRAIPNALVLAADTARCVDWWDHWHGPGEEPGDGTTRAAQYAADQESWEAAQFRAVVAAEHGDIAAYHDAVEDMSRIERPWGDDPATQEVAEVLESAPWGWLDCDSQGISSPVVHATLDAAVTAASEFARRRDWIEEMDPEDRPDLPVWVDWWVRELRTGEVVEMGSTQIDEVEPPCPSELLADAAKEHQIADLLKAEVEE